MPKKLLCFSTLSTAGVWNSEPCLPFVPEPKRQPCPEKWPAGSVSVLLVDTKSLGRARLGLCPLSGQGVSSFMEFAIMTVALSGNIVRVSLLFSGTEEKPQERMLLCF